MHTTDADKMIPGGGLRKSASSGHSEWPVATWPRVSANCGAGRVGHVGAAQVTTQAGLDPRDVHRPVGGMGDLQARAGTVLLK